MDDLGSFLEPVLSFRPNYYYLQNDFSAGTILDLEMIISNSRRQNRRKA